MPSIHSIRGIDVSENNGHVDWDAVVESGIKFVIVRSSYGQHGEDSLFKENVLEAQKRGLHVGAYHYSYGLTPEQVKNEALNCKRIIDEAGVFLDLPVWFDMEDADGYKERHGFFFDREYITELCKAWLEVIKPLYSGIYASESWFNFYIDWEELGCSVWNAAWLNSGSDDPRYHEEWDEIEGSIIWQYTNELNIGGKLFDGNYMYTNPFND